MIELTRTPCGPNWKRCSICSGILSIRQRRRQKIASTKRARRGSAFAFLRPHAKGGLGEVWVALDEELNRNVAFKEIQFRYAGHAESRTRFLREATVTGQLEHPGIV